MYKNSTFKLFQTSFLLVCFVLCCFHIQAQEKPFLIVLDAGHGGKDPGKVGYKNVKEKDIALKLTLKIGNLLKKQGVKVLYTRTSDKFIGLYERGRIANRAKANLFVSIHCNAHHTQASGAETWVLGTSANRANFEVAKAENKVILLEDDYKVKYKGFDPHSPESVIGLTLLQEDYLDESIHLASIVQKNLRGIKRKDRGVKQNIFVVLHQTYMPSILIEAGFITNKHESRFLKSNNGQNKVAKSISNSILEYIKELRKNSVPTNSSPSRNSKLHTEKNTVSKVPSSKSVTFKIQIASGRKMSTKSYNFKGLSGIERVKTGRFYKYYYGKTSNYQSAKKSLKKARKKGYKSAFIVAFNKGKKVALSTVLKK